MSILSERRLILQLFSIFEKHPHRRQNNQGNKVVAWALVNIRHPNLFYICQLLLVIHSKRVDSRLVVIVKGNLMAIKLMRIRLKTIRL